MTEKEVKLAEYIDSHQETWYKELKQKYPNEIGVKAKEAFNIYCKWQLGAKFFK